MSKRAILEGLLDKNHLKLLKLFINRSEQQFYLREISRLTKVPPASVYRVIRQFLTLELLIEHKIKKFKLYSFNTKDTEFLVDILADKSSALDDFVAFARSIPKVEMLIQHGKEERKKASVLLVGENLPMDSIKIKVGEIKEKFGFSIIYLAQSKAQYAQMSSMGLFPGKKKILYERINSFVVLILSLLYWREMGEV